MGDRCNMSIHCHAEDLEKIVEVFDEPLWEELDDVNAGELHLEFEEVNFAGADELETLRMQGVVFYGEHSAGDSYGRGAFVIDGGKLHWLSFTEEGLYAVGVGIDGEIVEEDLVYVREALSALRRVQRKIGGGTE